MSNIQFALPYLFVFLLLALNGLKIWVPVSFENINTKKEYELTNILTNLAITYVFIFFFCFRAYVYTDFETYKLFYDDIPQLFDFSKIKEFLKESMYATVGWEKGFLILSIFLKGISINYFFYQFYLSLIDFLVLYFFFKNYVKKNFLLCFCVFFIYGGVGIEFNLLRNSKSIMLFLISFKYLKNHNFWKYLCLNLIGVLFHTSSLIYIILYPVINKKISIRLIYILYFIGNIFFLLRVRWITLFIKAILNILSYGRISMLLDTYLENQSYGVTFSYIQRFFEFLFIQCIGLRKIKYDEEYQLYNCFYLYHLMYLFLFEILVFVERFPTLFVFSYWILLVLIFNRLDKHKKIVFFLILLAWGTIIIGKSNSRQICYYDNYLTGYKSYTERVNLLRGLK